MKIFSGMLLIVFFGFASELALINLSLSKKTDNLPKMLKGEKQKVIIGILGLAVFLAYRITKQLSLWEPLMLAAFLIGTRVGIYWTEYTK